MSSTNYRYIDSEKSIYHSDADYVSLPNYHQSFYSAPKTSLIRMAIAPGTVKYFNKTFTPQALARNENSSTISASEIGFIPLKPNGTDDVFDYASYSQIK